MLNFMGNLFGENTADLKTLYKHKTKVLGSKAINDPC